MTLTTQRMDYLRAKAGTVKINYKMSDEELDEMAEAMLNEQLAAMLMKQLAEIKSEYLRSVRLSPVSDQIVAKHSEEIIRDLEQQLKTPPEFWEINTEGFICSDRDLDNVSKEHLRLMQDNVFIAETVKEVARFKRVILEKTGEILELHPKNQARFMAVLDGSTFSVVKKVKSILAMWNKLVCLVADVQASAKHQVEIISKFKEEYRTTHSLPVSYDLSLEEIVQAKADELTKSNEEIKSNDKALELEHKELIRVKVRTLFVQSTEVDRLESRRDRMRPGAEQAKSEWDNRENICRRSNFIDEGCINDLLIRTNEKINAYNSMVYLFRSARDEYEREADLHNAKCDEYNKARDVHDARVSQYKADMAELGVVELAQSQLKTNEAIRIQLIEAELTEMHEINQQATSVIIAQQLAAGRVAEMFNMVADNEEVGQQDVASGGFDQHEQVEVGVMG